MASRPENVRLYCILARDAPRAVLFRRGPSKRVLLVSWDTSNDTFDDGQWLNGRIYERRCDLSPDGELLLYFAATWKGPYQSWSAVSRPPYLTALALWPKGDGWGGGGHFTTSRNIALNHRNTEMALAADFHLPKWLQITPFGDHSGWGEDNPVWAERLVRDGWLLAGKSTYTEDRKGKVWINFDPPVVWEKKHPAWPDRYVLRMVIHGLKERDGPWYLTDHQVSDSQTGQEITLPRSDWAEWSATGDLLYTRHGRLYRCEREPNEFPLPLRERLLHDFTDREFRECAAPPEARRWPGR